MPFLSCGLGAEQPLLDADVIGLGNGRDPAAPFAVAAGVSVAVQQVLNANRRVALNSAA
jgi:hypothetical protein